ncbi:hypothetical protein LZP81_29700 [Streptomyces parvulus]|uniref:hypothetical protein n=1 Tax=Streptomyces parvulus TaxID=146923 RepID=UPI001E31DA71|nr:hypothetical protein [Streptomyces parvulus]MCC9158400.1 hypothetical protein [Streptomyces parvulus]MCE7691036.1 hypothetical protein [Streptomyces parvulus]
MEWKETATRFVVGLVALPVATGMFAFLFIRIARLYRPWRKKYQPHSLAKSLRVKSALRDNPRKAVTAARYFEVRIALQLREVQQNYRLQAKVREKVRGWALTCSTISIVLLELSLFSLAAIQEDDPWRMAPISVGGFISFLIFFFTTRSAALVLMREEGFGWAYVLAVRCLALCADLPRGRSTPLALDQEASALSKALGNFALVGYPGMTDQRKKDVQQHVLQVQQALHFASAEVLKRGAPACKEFAQIIGVLVARLAEQRWQSLLDGDQLVENDAALAHSIPEGRRKDAWIVIVGASVAAIFVVVATSLGVPPTATVPAALVFLIGPAALWGSKSLGFNHRSLMRSSTDSLVQQSQQSGGPSPSGQAGSAAA